MPLEFIFSIVSFIFFVPFSINIFFCFINLLQTAEVSLEAPNIVYHI